MNIYNEYMYSYPHKTAYRPLEDAQIQDYLPILRNGSNDLYIHLPFCESKCGYCNLFSLANVDNNYIDLYIEQLSRQFKQYDQEVSLQEVKWKSVILGGGTPTLLSIEQLERLFTLIERFLGLRLEQLPVVIEGSPGQCSRELLTYLKRRGIYRISLGVQSFVEAELRRIGRVFTPETCRKVLNNIKDMGFLDRNIDLIYGLPEQTRNSFCYSLKEALSYNTDEIFLYPLYVKPETGLYNKFTTDPQLQFSMYQAGRSLLLEEGYTQTSMRRFTKTNKIEYQSCGFETILAIGCGGRSYLGDLHFCSPYGVSSKRSKEILENYLKQDNFFSGNYGFLLNEEEHKRRFIIKNLFYYQGISITEYSNLFHSQLVEDYPIINTFVKDDYAYFERDRIKLSMEGMAYSDYLGPKFISKQVEVNMKEYPLC